jgi:hypothetical protein
LNGSAKGKSSGTQNKTFADQPPVLRAVVRSDPGGAAMNAHHVQEAGPIPRTPNVVFNPGTDLERDQVRDQLRRILTGSAFHNSKRYAAVLKFIVEQTLEGYGDRLKERTIGIEVFDRPPDYDTATDHAVRSAVAEVRKRLAQYYLGEADGELRIEILPGSYMPQFRWPEEKLYPTHRSPQVGANGMAPGIALSDAARGVKKTGIRFFWITAVCAALVGAAVAVVDVTRTEDPLAAFWRPILSSRTPILLCIGNVEGGQQTPTQIQGLSPTLSLSDFHNSPFSTVNVYDAFTLAKFAGLLQANDKKIRFASQSDATFTDLQTGPTILVGLLNNSWTERLMPRLRFTVEKPTPDKVIIRDRENASRNDWSIDYSTPYLDVTKDYALVLRMVDPKTEQPVVVDAGITVFGTSAAGDFLTNANDLKKLAAIAPPGWEKKNMELVLATDVIRGRHGPATIVATNFW